MLLYDFQVICGKDENKYDIDKLTEFVQYLDNSGYDLVFTAMSTVGRTLIIAISQHNQNYIGISWVIFGYVVFIYVVFLYYTLLGLIYGYKTNKIRKMMKLPKMIQGTIKSVMLKLYFSLILVALIVFCVLLAAEGYLDERKQIKQLIINKLDQYKQYLINNQEEIRQNNQMILKKFIKKEKLN